MITMIMWTNERREMHLVQVWDPLCLGDKLIVETLKEPNEGYGGVFKNWTPYTIICFLSMLMNELNAVTMICFLLCYITYYVTFPTMIHFFETLVKFSFMSSLYKSLQILEKSRFGLDESCHVSVTNLPLAWMSRNVFFEWHVLEKRLEWVG